MEFICDNEKENWEPGDEANHFTQFPLTKYNLHYYVFPGVDTLTRVCNMECLLKSLL